MIDAKRLQHVAVCHVWDHGGQYEWCLGDFTEDEAVEVLRLARLGLSAEAKLKVAVEALTILVVLKDHKEIFGKDDLYTARQSTAWTQARSALAKIGAPHAK